MQRLTALALHRPVGTLVLLGLVSLLAAAGAVQLRSETGYRAALGAGHPEVQRLDRFIQDFGGGLPVVIAWGCPEDSPCDEPLGDASLGMAHELTETLLELRGIRGVSGPTTMPLFDKEGEARFLRSGASPPELRELAIRDPLWRGTLVSSDGGAAAIWVELESSDPDQYDSAVTALVRALAPFEAQGFRFALVGDPIDFVIGGGELNKEPKKLSVVTLAVVFVVLWGLFGSLRAPLPALATVGVAVLWTVGLMGWAGWPENEISQALVPLLLVVGVCDGLHFLSRFVGISSDRGTRRERLEMTARDVGRACAITSLTTAAGFASFATSDLESFVRFGLTAGFGVVAALALTFTMLPVLIEKMGLEIDSPRTLESWRRALLLLLAASERRGTAILAVSAVVTAVAIFGVSALRVDVSKETLMGSASQIVVWQNWVEENLRKPDTLEVRLSIPEGLDVAAPQTFEALGTASEILEANPNLGRARSLLEPVARFNQILHDGDGAFFRQGDSEEQNAQILFAIGAVDRALLDRWLTVERRHLRVSAEAELLPKSERLNVVRESERALGQALPGWGIELTGPLRVFGEMVDGIHSTQTRSFLAAFVLISVLLVVSLRSLWAASLVMVPTLFPVAVTLGAMGLAGVALDTGTAMLAAVLLGIAVDDGVHLVSRYQEERKQGLSPHPAMRQAIVQVGRPLVASSIALALGFLSLLMSSWGAIASFGFLAAVTIAIALAADLLILPALLFAFVGADDDGAYEPPRPSHRALGSIATVLLGVGVPLVAVILLAASGQQVLRDDRVRLPACLPSGIGVVLPTAALSPGCPLQIFEVARRAPGLAMLDGISRSRPEAAAVEAIAVRGGKQVKVALPRMDDSPSGRRTLHLVAGGVSLVVVALCALVFWRSSTAAALPVLLASLCVTGVLVGAASGRVSSVAQWAEVVAIALSPGVAIHLALTFPVARPLLRAAPRVLLLIYAGTLALAITCFVGYTRFPELFSLGSKIAVGTTAIACSGVLVGCVVAIRSESSALERRRARVLLGGLCGVALVAMTAYLMPSADASHTGRLVEVLALACLLTVLVGAFAVNRYGLFELVEGRIPWVARTTQGAFVLSLVLVLAWLFGSGPTSIVWALTGAVSSWLLISFGRLWSLDSRVAARTMHMSLLSRLHAQKMQTLPSRAELCGVSLSMIREGLGAPWGSVFLRSEVGWYLIHASPGAVEDEHLAALAAIQVLERSLLHLAGSHSSDLHSQELSEAGVEIVAAIEAGGETLGVILLGPTGDAYSRAELSFVTTVAAQCAVALRWHAASEKLREIERIATRGHLAASMAHDLGKPIEVSWGIARSLLNRNGLAPDVVGALQCIQARTDDALAIVDRLLSPVDAGGNRRAVGDLLSSAVEEVKSRYSHRIRLSVSPELPAFEGSVELHQVLVGVLENACIASSPTSPVEVVATSQAGELVLEVVDAGCGMSPEIARRAFELWFTTRQTNGGRGLGLGLCRSLLAPLGGRIEIASTTIGVGTTIRIVLGGAST